MAKQQGIVLFMDFDVNKVTYPAVLVIDTDFSTDGVVGPFNNADELKTYIEKHKLSECHDSFSVSTLSEPK